MITSTHTTFKRALLAGAFLVAGGGASLADYNAGSAAFNAGNYTQAYEEFKQSADAGNSLSQFMLGRLYAEGHGVTEDKVAAYMWFDLSASNGNSRAIAARDSIAAELDATEIDRAQDMAAEWRSTRQTLGTSSTPTPVAAATSASPPYSLRNVQEALSELGYSVGTPDGVIGPKSRAAIRAFQIDAGLPESGEPSIALYEELQAVLAERSGSAEVASQPAPAVSSAQIMEAQTELRRRGYAISAITGVANAETLAAVRDYQTDARLQVTGQIDDSLLQQLRTAKTDSAAMYREQVKQVQAALNEAGYDAGPPDGALGPRSRAAISSYQTDKNLAATGNVNAETLASLGIGDAEQAAQQQVDSGTIRQTQEELQAHGYAIDDLSGTLDPQTRTAIEDYQRDAGLAVTGEASNDLLEHLRTSGASTTTIDSEIVLDVEDELQRHGYTVGPLDGVIDPRTRTAIRDYQADAGLAVTGQADDALLSHLRSSEVRPLPADAVTEIQFLLNRLGYLAAAGDGVIGPQSTLAISRYQGDRGLAVTGRPSMDLLSKLRTEQIAEPGANN